MRLVNTIPSLRQANAFPDFLSPREQFAAGFSCGRLKAGRRLGERASNAKYGTVWVWQRFFWDLLQASNGR